MVESLTRTISYICPFCSGVTQKQIGIFRFSGNSKADLFCSDEVCTEKCASIIPSGDKYKISVECPICGEMHTYTISQSAFWTRNLISFQCLNSGIDIFYIGEQKAVTKAVDENNMLLEDLADAFEEIDPDSTLTFSILDELHRLIKGNNIYCSCGKNSVGIDMTGDDIVITCMECGKEAIYHPSQELLKFLKGSKKNIILVK